MSLYWPWQQRWCPRRHQTRLSWYWAVSLVGCERPVLLVQTCAWYTPSPVIIYDILLLTKQIAFSKQQYFWNHLFTEINFLLKHCLYYFLFVICRDINHGIDGMVPGSTRLYLTVQMYTGGMYTCTLGNYWIIPW